MARMGSAKQLAIKVGLVQWAKEAGDDWEFDLEVARVSTKKLCPTCRRACRWRATLRVTPSGVDEGQVFRSVGGTAAEVACAVYQRARKTFHTGGGPQLVRE